jgi:hypothetical protein
MNAAPNVSVASRTSGGTPGAPLFSRPNEGVICLLISDSTNVSVTVVVEGMGEVTGAVPALSLAPVCLSLPRPLVDGNFSLSLEAVDAVGNRAVFQHFSWWVVDSVEPVVRAIPM